MISALETYFPETVTWNRPEGGMFLWLTLPEGSSAEDILQHCLEQDVAFVPGHVFFPDGTGRNTMRLNFSNAAPTPFKRDQKDGRSTETPEDIGTIAGIIQKSRIPLSFPFFSPLCPDPPDV